MIDYQRKIEADAKVQAAIKDVNNNFLVKYKDGKVELKLGTEKHPRKIGKIEDGCLYVERTLSKHLHRKSNAYGFNYFLIKKSKSFNYVVLVEDGEYQYKIPKDSILQYGKVMNFKNSEDGNSFELQIFLNRDIIKRYS